MMATNMPEALDEALLRPGRIDRIYKVGYPSKEGRVRTLRGLPRQGVPRAHRPTRSTSSPPSRPTPPAPRSRTWSTRPSSTPSATAARRSPGPTSIKAKQLKELGPPEDVEYIERERHAIAVHEACHAVAAYRIRQHLTDRHRHHREGRRPTSAWCASIPPEDQFTHWRSEYEADIMVVARLAGRRAAVLRGRQLVGRVRRPRVRHHRRHADGGLLGHGPDRRLPRRHPPGRHRRRRQARRRRGRTERDLLKGNLGERIEANLADLLDRAEQLLAENRAEVLRRRPRPRDPQDPHRRGRGGHHRGHGGPADRRPGLRGRGVRRGHGGVPHVGGRSPPGPRQGGHPAAGATGGPATPEPAPASPAPAAVPLGVGVLLEDPPPPASPSPSPPPSGNGGSSGGDGVGRRGVVGRRRIGQRRPLTPRRLRA